MTADPVSTATKTVADLNWLEGFARKRTELHEAVIPLRLAAALIRNQVIPFFKQRPERPVHVVVVGGAGTGKSTVVNFLIGRAVAEVNPQAGFTRHPVAYVEAGSPAQLQLHEGILGPLRPIPGPVPSDRDEDVFQVRQLALAGGAGPEPKSPLLQAVVWDCPDMTTWKANDYQTRLVETIGLADLVVYVASDERYNDAWPTQYLRYILQAGKPVAAVLTKMQTGDADALMQHFRQEIIAKIPECTGVFAVVPLPQLSAAEQADPAGVGKLPRGAITQPIVWWLQHPQKTRRDSVQRALSFLNQFQDKLLVPARHDLAAVEQWDRWVEDGKRFFSERYQNEYLSGEQFHRFNAALVRLIELLELPGVGQIVSKTMHYLRAPYRWMKTAFKRPDVNALPEAEVLAAGFQGWLDRLRRETLQQDKEHPIWKTLRDAFHDKRDEPLLKQLRRSVDEFSLKQSLETEATARAIYEELEKSPTTLNTLRGFKFSFEAAGLTTAIMTAGTHLLLYPLLLPFAASITQGLTEVLGKKYVDAQREKARDRQRVLFEQTLATPLAGELSAWPGSLIPTLPELRGVVDRLPLQLAELQQTVSHLAPVVEGAAA
jgi:GTP-binding protein EngB required for normal cell division